MNICLIKILQNHNPKRRDTKENKKQIFQTYKQYTYIGPDWER